MTPLAEWVKPPRPLLAALLLFAMVCVSALAWFGWQVLEQERLVAAQRSQERLEQAADRIAVAIRANLTASADRLDSVPAPSNGDVILRLTDRTVEAQPPRLLFYPGELLTPQASPQIFAAAEQIEFALAEPLEALPLYQQLATSADPAIRAGALLRQARVLRNLGRDAASRTAYQELAAIPSVRVAGAPAGLVALHAMAELSSDPSEAESMRRSLASGRWHLTRAQFEFYWSDLDRLQDMHREPPADALALSEVAATVWDRRRSEARAEESLWVSGRPFLLLSRGRTVLVTLPSRFLPAADDLAVALLDSEGRTLAGQRAEQGQAAVRTRATSSLPWTLYVSGAPVELGIGAERRFLLAGLGIMILFVLAGTGLIARAILRDWQTQRMQSDFVAAVSHEFRSPLTSLRQLSEMLAAGRVPSSERRQLYYETLVDETGRLQRLVESLLNFGRMEAGARQYHFQELDAGEAVVKVVSELGEGAQRIILHDPGIDCPIQADPDAISVVLRNVIDNALKYSPADRNVEVSWGVDGSRVAIRVSDQGPGISRSERKDVFRKFVRGSAARAGNVKGSGLGLAMVRHIVAAHGGDIKLESIEGQGTVFTILLPMEGGPRRPLPAPAVEPEFEEKL